MLGTPVNTSSVTRTIRQRPGIAKNDNNSGKNKTTNNPTMQPPNSHRTKLEAIHLLCNTPHNSRHSFPTNTKCTTHNTVTRRQPALIRGYDYRTPGNYWAGQINFGWSKNGHANAVQFRVVASGCGPKAFASFVLFRNDVVQIKLYAFLPRSSVNSSVGCFFGCVTRRKLQTPGNAEEHTQKKQETPTINPIGPTDKPHRPRTKHYRKDSLGDA